MRGLLRCSATLVAAAAATLAAAVPAGAAQLADPADPALAYTPWHYAAQLPWGPLEEGASHVPEAAAPGAFLTLPFRGAHYVTSGFDHCNPDYTADGVICRFDGTVSYAGNGSDWLGYSITAGKADYLYYDGHDGYDYGLFYEPVLAAADGVVTMAGWSVPSCPKCGFGLGVKIDHQNGYSTLYGHLSHVAVSTGQRVRRGQVLGTSGTTGSSTGEHLHFGLYLTQAWLPVDPYGWYGAGPDPWGHDAGDLWLGGSPQYPPPAPAQVQAAAFRDRAQPASIDVSWSGAGDGGAYDVMVVTDGGPVQSWLQDVTGSSASFTGEPGHQYWFMVSARSALGMASAAVTTPVWTRSPERPALRP